MQLLDAKKINVPYQIEIFETLPSTNDYLKQFYGKNKNKIKICLAEMQTNGKGRFNRRWHSPFGQNIYLSILYPFTKKIDELSGLSLITGLSLCKTIEEAYSLPEAVFVKWPNDIIIAKQKIAGILIEIQAETNSICHPIIGIGINVNMTDSSWPSLRKLTNKIYDRNILCTKLINNFMHYIEQFNQHGFKSFMNEWRIRDNLNNKIIQVKSGNNDFKGRALGIDQHGNLLLKTADNKIISFSSGDTTVLKGNR